MRSGLGEAASPSQSGEAFGSEMMCEQRGSVLRDVQYITVEQCARKGVSCSSAGTMAPETRTVAASWTT